MGKKSLATIICALVVFLLTSSVPAMTAGQVECADKDNYIVTTADGVKLAMKHYRPDKTARFNRGAQPILMMPSILSNINEFDMRTPEGEQYDVILPSPLAPWARYDRYIKKDPMRYYSLAHYLWLQGYDVWMGNYRGEGREPTRSEGAYGYSIDDLGIYDAPALVEKVYEVTRRHPIWLGHSMGATIAYIYLQGAKYGPGKNPHVVSDPALVKERNNGHGPQSIKAFVDMDGPMVPFDTYMLDNGLTWWCLYWPFYLDIRPVLEQYGEVATYPLKVLGEMLWKTVEAFGLPHLDWMNTLLSINGDDMADGVLYFGIKYCFDGMSIRALAQFVDASAHGVLREDYYNGTYNMYPPEPREGDGYYYYGKNLDKISIPTLVLADDRMDITNPEDIKNFYLGKKRTKLDEFMRVSGTAHVDLVCGLKCPTIVFPKVGDWLRKVCRRCW